MKKQFITLLQRIYFGILSGKNIGAPLAKNQYTLPVLWLCASIISFMSTGLSYHSVPLLFIAALIWLQTLNGTYKNPYKSWDRQ